MSETATNPTGEPARARGPVDGAQVNHAIVRFKGVNIWYGDRHVVDDVTLDIPHREVTAIIGPSGSGKSTLLRAVNRMNDLIPSARMNGRVTYHGEHVYDRGVDPAEVRRRIGMVFQKPNPFQKSIRENVLFGPRINGVKRKHDDIIEEALTRAALWDEVKDGLDRSAMELSGGQQQRLCIARALASRPDVLLMDEPCSSLDPIATLRIEELMRELARDHTIIVVTHNMQQAARVSDRTAFFGVDYTDDGPQPGRLIEFDFTKTMFTRARNPRTEAYITGRYG